MVATLKSRPFALVLAAWCSLTSLSVAEEANWRVEEIERELGVGYAVRLVDVNADDRRDIVVVDTTRVVWYENPSWRRHTIIEGQTEPDNVCIAAHDIDGDGRIDFALGAAWKPFQPFGTIQWLTRGPQGEEWTVHSIGEEATVHRMNWADLDGDGRQELVVVPLVGRGATGPLFNERPIRILAYAIPEHPVAGPWTPQVVNEELYVAHNFQPTDLDRDGRTDLLVASFEGVSWLARGDDGVWARSLLGQGNQETSPNRGASEIKLGRLADGADYIATIEPWHGFQVVVYTRPDDPAELWKRTVVDEELKWGHAVWCANLDADEDEELMIGVRDNHSGTSLCGLRIYDPVDGGAGWRRQIVDAGGVAIEDLAAADLNDDGRTDVVAVGRATRNVRIYWNEE